MTRFQLKLYPFGSTYYKSCPKKGIKIPQGAQLLIEPAGFDGIFRIRKLRVKICKVTSVTVTYWLCTGHVLSQKVFTLLCQRENMSSQDSDPLISNQSKVPVDSTLNKILKTIFFCGSAIYNFRHFSAIDN